MMKKLDSNYTRILRAISNKSWRQHSTKQQLYGYPPPIMKIIQVRRTRHAEHWWRNRDELISDIRYEKAVYSPFLYENFQWESCVESGCCICSQSIKNNNTLTIQSVVCNCFNTRKMSFCVNVTMDETLIHLFTSESNQLSVEWTAAGESHPKRPMTQTSAGKVLASVFWDAQDILFIDYLEKGTINSEYYTALLVRLKEEITKKKKKRPKMKKKKGLFHQDNAQGLKSIATMAKLHELHFELLLHPPYSPDLVPNDYWLFPDLKRMLQGKGSDSNEEVISETEPYFVGRL